MTVNIRPDIVVREQLNLLDVVPELFDRSVHTFVFAYVVCVFLAVILSVSPVINFVCLFVVTIQSVNFVNIIIRTSIFSLIDEYRSSDNFGSPCICLKKGIH